MSVRAPRVCVSVCVWTRVGCDAWSSRWPLLVCDVHGRSSKSPAQVLARISSHFCHGQEGGGWGVMTDGALGLPAAGRQAGRRAPSSLPSQLGIVSSSSQPPSSSSSSLSPSSLFSGAGPRLSSRAKGVDTGTPSPEVRPRPWAETDTPPSSSMALPGGLLWVYGQGASSGCPGCGLRAWKHMERGQTA